MNRIFNAIPPTNFRYIILFFNHDFKRGFGAQDFDGDAVAMKTVIKIGAHADRIEHHHNSSSVDVVETHSVPTTPTPIDNYNHILQQHARSQQHRHAGALGPVERKHQEQWRKASLCTD